ncbi:MAG: DUF4132 domain-containing protein [Eubacterium sp.]|nr:DUF4132 domain-containing protein [Eubacterium sp.]
MADYDYNTRAEISKKLDSEREQRILKLPKKEQELAWEIAARYGEHKQIDKITRLFYEEKGRKPSAWFGAHKKLLHAFLPDQYMNSFLSIIDKLNQFPFSRGWNRRTVRTASYGPQIGLAFSLLRAYEKLFYCGDKLEDYIYWRLDPEKLDYIRHDWNFDEHFSLIYAAEIDRGNEKVIQALRDVIESETNTSYLDRQMILGIFQSDHKQLQQLVCGLLLAARLQEGLRQAICETMDEGTPEAFLMVLSVIQNHGLIRFSSVKRAVSTWIGIFDENSADRVSAKLLDLMGQCLTDPAVVHIQLQTNDAVAINAALWALGFREAETASAAVMELIAHGTKSQKLAASFYNQNLYEERIKIQAAKKAILEHADDLELVAAFMPAFTAQLSQSVRSLLFRNQTRPTEIEQPDPAVLTDYFESLEDAQNEYRIFWDIYKRLPKKGVVYDPCIFPWYRVALSPSDVVRQLAFISYVLQDEEKITEMAAHLGEISANGYERGYFLNLLLYRPKNARQKKLLIQAMGNAEESTSSKAIALVKQLSLQEADYRLIESMLRFKRSTLRSQLLEFLMGQDDTGMQACLERLLSDKKEEKRTAGLDLLLRLSKQKEKTAFYARVKELAREITQPSDKEQVLVDEILTDPQSSIALQKGFGIYDPSAAVRLPSFPQERGAALRMIPLTEQETIAKIKKLDAWIHENRNYEYESLYWEKQLLGNKYTLIKKNSAPDEKENFPRKFLLEDYPLEQELRAFYETEIGDYGAFVEWEARLLLHNRQVYENGKLFYEAVFGRMPFLPKPLEITYQQQISDIRLNYRYTFLDTKLLWKAGVQTAQALSRVISPENKLLTYTYKQWNEETATAKVCVSQLPILDRLLEGLGYWETDEEFEQSFFAALALELNASEETDTHRFVQKPRSYNRWNTQAVTPLVPYWFFKAYHMELISWDDLLKALFEYFDRRNVLNAITSLVKGDYKKPSNRLLWENFFGAYTKTGQPVWEQAELLAGADTWCGRLAQNVYDAMIPPILDTELRRGEAETVFSADIGGIAYVQGIAYFVRILMALGNDTLGRETYYSWYSSNSNTKREVLSMLLKACYPNERDDARALAQALGKTKIRAERLVEAAMYAPQWISLIEEYLGWTGLKSGCYYFMAHMNEQFDDQKMAVIARYTPLSAQELQEGAFDIDWFREAYGLLGEKNFAVLYKAAKYIADGQKHSRARKYADAAAGNIPLADLRAQIGAKRNKDLLMSYGLVPFGRNKEKDLLQRYQFIQNFAKEAKQFGAQRRASETRAAQTALLNLSVHAGYADVTRLTLNMESRMAEQFAPWMEWNRVEDVEIRLFVDETGNSEIICRKGEKTLKSVPSRLKKNPAVLEIKQAQKALKEQYRRAKKLMEESMEDGAEFTAAETAALLRNPVVRAILSTLVWIQTDGETAGWIALPESRAQTKETENAAKQQKQPRTQLTLLSLDGSRTELDGGARLRIAHPLDLYRADIWHSCQKYLFDHQIRQPFKQVFRELYVKLPEELAQKTSRMFAGNQIQPQKTAACLKGRRWIADYEEGLQKIYYKENIIARIYALTDWFSPSDVEAPTLEWVEFCDRKTFAPLTIEQVPDLIYSEVMRDVDLAVSVAHAGGVDPQTSHSTIEMRRAIAQFSLPLFGLSNVELKDSHALIRGTRATYNVHLGSGTVHQEGGAMINILPVHSQSRGKLFLPFVDEDPKTAEILSKIVLLAEDAKIKDPFLLNQIR